MERESMKDHELERFREAQALAYRCTVDVAENLSPGATERQAAAALHEALVREGVSTYFHRPFAWFGDRTCFEGVRSPLDFFPTRRRLERGMAGILDVAPSVDGYAVDIGYAFSCGPNAELDALCGALVAFRELIATEVAAGSTLRAIYEAVDRRISAIGARNCHQRYPFQVLAHRVFRMSRGRVARSHLFGFGLGASVPLLVQLAASRVPRLRRSSPVCSPASDAPPAPGLWAFEPHIARGDVGAKWEEILVVEEAGCHWLEDAPPHVRRGRSAAFAHATS